MRRLQIFGGLFFLCVAGAASAQTDPTILQQWGINKDGSFRSLVEVRSAKKLITSGAEVGRGAIRLNDTIAPVSMEIGFYEYGGGIFLDDLFEFFSQGVSIRNFSGTVPSYLAVRDPKDIKDIRLSHDGTFGIVTTTGSAPGGIRIGGNGPNTFSTGFGTVLEMEDSGSVVFYGPRIVMKGSAPAVTSCGSGSAVAGSNTAMSVTVGGGGASSCMVAFASAYPAAPSCVAQSDTDVVPLKLAETPTSVTVTSSSALTAGSRLKIHCLGIM